MLPSVKKGAKINLVKRKYFYGYWNNWKIRFRQKLFVGKTQRKTKRNSRGYRQDFTWRFA